MFTREQIAMAIKCKDSNELLALAKSSGFDMTKAEADKYFAQLSANKELSIDDLETLAGGCTGNICVGNASAGC